MSANIASGRLTVAGRIENAQGFVRRPRVEETESEAIAGAAERVWGKSMAARPYVWAECYSSAHRQRELYGELWDVKLSGSSHAQTVRDFRDRNPVMWVLRCLGTRMMNESANVFGQNLFQCLLQDAPLENLDVFRDGDRAWLRYAHQIVK